MKTTIIAVLATFAIGGCATSNSMADVQVEDNDKIAVCGEVGGDKQTYPTMGDLKSDGAKFLSYGPCYEQ